MITQDAMTAQAYRAVIDDRIHELWKDRTWYRTHPGWIVQQEVESRAELRLLVGLARKARELARPSTDLEPARDATYAHDDHIARPQPETCSDCFFEQQRHIPEAALWAAHDPYANWSESERRLGWGDR